MIDEGTRGEGRASSLSCEEVGEVLVEYLQTELHELQEVEVLLHLEGCSACNGEKEELLSVLGCFGDLGEEMPAEEGGWARLLGTIESETGVQADFSLASPRLAPLFTLMAASILAVAFVLVFWQEGSTGATVSGPEVLRGEVRLERPGVYRVLGADSQGSFLRTGDVLSTSEDVAALQWGPGTTVHLNRRCRIRLTGPNSIELLSGEVFCRVSPRSKLPPLGEITTGEGRIRVVGTRFGVERLQEGTRVTVLRGEVTFERSGHSLPVSSGFSCLARSGSDSIDRPAPVEQPWRFAQWTQPRTIHAHLERVDSNQAWESGRPVAFRLSLKNVGGETIWIRSFHPVSPYYFLRLSLRGETLVQSRVDFRSVRPAGGDTLLSLEPGEESFFEFTLRLPEQDGFHELSVVYQNGEVLEVPGGALWRGFIESNRVAFRIEFPG